LHSEARKTSSKGMALERSCKHQGLARKQIIKNNNKMELGFERWKKQDVLEMAAGRWKKASCLKLARASSPWASSPWM